jgi:chemotaxis protein histidine kinase CheA
MSPLEMRIHELRLRFITSLPQRIAAIRRAWMRIPGNGSDAAAMNELQRQLHTLAGTAGTYGLADIAAVACEAELICDAAATATDEEELHYVGTLLADLEKLIHRRSAPAMLAPALGQVDGDAQASWQ